MPRRCGTYPGLVTGSFTLLDFPTDRRYGSLPTTMHVERQGEDLMLDAPDEVERRGPVVTLMRQSGLRFS